MKGDNLITFSSEAGKLAISAISPSRLPADLGDRRLADADARSPRRAGRVVLRGPRTETVLPRSLADMDAEIRVSGGATATAGNVKFRLTCRSDSSQRGSITNRQEATVLPSESLVHPPVSCPRDH